MDGKEILGCIIWIGVIAFFISKCKEPSNSKTEESNNTEISEPVNVDFSKIGADKRTCPVCGYVYDAFDVNKISLREHGMCDVCYSKKCGTYGRSSGSSSSGSGNQYGAGYEQGLEDGEAGNDYDDSGGNGQYRKGYEDGYEEGQSNRSYDDE